MEIRLTVAEAARMFEIWMQELERNPGARSVENSQIKLDTNPSVEGAVHLMDGALVQIWYKAAEPATAQAISEAHRATVEFGLPRQLYTGRLIDIKRAKPARVGEVGLVYFKVKAIEREGSGFRSFNPSKGQLIEMTINPAAATLTGAPSAAVQAAIQPSVTPVAPVAPGVVLRRED